MRSLKKALSAFCALILLVSTVSLTAFADGANVSYEGNTGKWIFAPGSEQSPTDLFSDFKNVMPGASLTQKITVRNQADNKVKVKIYLRSLGSADAAYNDFLDQLTLTVTKDTDTPLFEAEADKTAGLTDWVCLGTLYAGGALDLTVTLDVPATLDNTYQKKMGEINWQFVAEEFPLEQPAWDCPTDQKHAYHIEEIDGVSTFVCDDCGQTEAMKCKVCGGTMREAVTVVTGGKTYVAYPDGPKHYQSADGSVHFYLNDDSIIDYYTVDGAVTDIKSVNEYTLYQYYECLKNPQHHTDPHTPQTGDDSPLGLWLALMAASGSGLLLLLLLRRRRRDSEEAREP